jgi:hypothetical protein
VTLQPLDARFWEPPEGHLGVGTAMAVIVLVNLVLLGTLAFAISRWRANRRRGHAAGASVTTELPAKPGEAVLEGVVEADPVQPPMTITIHEFGSEASTRRSTKYEWSEIRRDVHTEPFQLVLASGERVRVEPDDTVLLASVLEQTSSGTNPRIRVARILDGERAYVVGDLAVETVGQADTRDVGPYRGANPTSFVLRRGRERLLVSTEPLGRRFERRARLHGRAAGATFFVLVAFNALVGRATVINAFGSDVDAEVVDTKTWTRTSERRGLTEQYTGYTVFAKYRDPAYGKDVSVYDNVSERVFQRLQLRRVLRVPFRVVRWAPSLCTIGPGATLDAGRLVLPSFGVVALLVSYARVRRRSGAWYERAKLHESGEGPLEL